MTEIIDLSFSYRKNTVLDGLNMKLYDRKYILIGENGAGKTTLFRCISGYFRYYKGKIINEKGKSPDVGYLPQKFGCYNHFTVREALEYIALIKNVRDSQNEVDHCIAIMKLEDIADKKVGKLSGGMMKRLGIAQAVIGSPDIILLDEPTAGLDIRQKSEFYSLMNEIKEETAIVISTHIMDDIRNIEGEILVLADGKLDAPGWLNSDESLEEKYLCYQPQK